MASLSSSLRSGLVGSGITGSPDSGSWEDTGSPWEEDTGVEAGLPVLSEDSVLWHPVRAMDKISMVHVIRAMILYELGYLL